MDALESQLSGRLAEIRERIATACGRAGRDPATVRLVAITKYVSPEVAAALHRAGQLELGESRPQELWRKADALPKSIQWHLVGHLQRNKVERTLPLTTLIHSVDSIRLLEAINAAAKQTAPVLLEVNMSREQAKHGFSPGEVEHVGDRLRDLPNVEVRGFMTMAALAESEAARTTFRELRQLRDTLAQRWQRPLAELSMGMSNDFEVAIEEGATIVRLGSVLFEGIISEPA